jgi:hypothetical protein
MLYQLSYSREKHQGSAGPVVLQQGSHHGAAYLTLYRQPTTPAP